MDNLIGPVVSLSTGFLQLRLGPRRVLCLSCLPYLASWLLLSAPRSVGYLYGARVLDGVATALVSTSVYAEEVASKELRGTLNSLQIVLRYLIGHRIILMERN